MHSKQWLNYTQPLIGVCALTRSNKIVLKLMSKISCPQFHSVYNQSTMFGINCIAYSSRLTKHKGTSDQSKYACLIKFQIRHAFEHVKLYNLCKLEPLQCFTCQFHVLMTSFEHTCYPCSADQGQGLPMINLPLCSYKHRTACKVFCLFF